MGTDLGLTVRQWGLLTTRAKTEDIPKKRLEGTDRMLTLSKVVIG